MISATDTPNILRVSFPVEVSDSRQMEVVCFVRAESSGIGIYYSHHQWRRRATPGGVWEDENSMRLSMTPQLETQILASVPNEIWSAFARTVRVLPGDVGAKISMISFEVPAQGMHS